MEISDKISIQEELEFIKVFFGQDWFDSSIEKYKKRKNIITKHPIISLCNDVEGIVCSKDERVKGLLFLAENATLQLVNVASYCRSVELIKIVDRLGCVSQKRAKDFFLPRLKDKSLYDSILYELCIATHYIRNGFEVSFFDDNACSLPEFIALKNGKKIHVECKNFTKSSISPHLEDSVRKIFNKVEKLLNGQFPSLCILLTLHDELGFQYDEVFRDLGASINSRTYPYHLERNSYSIDLIDVPKLEEIKLSSLKNDFNKVMIESEGYVRSKVEEHIGDSFYSPLYFIPMYGILPINKEGARILNYHYFVVNKSVADVDSSKIISKFLKKADKQLSSSEFSVVYIKIPNYLTTDSGLRSVVKGLQNSLPCSKCVDTLVLNGVVSTGNSFGMTAFSINNASSDKNLLPECGLPDTQEISAFN